MENTSKIPTERVLTLDDKLENIDNRFSTTNTRIDDLDSKLDEKYNELNTKLDEKIAELNSKIQQLENRLYVKEFGQASDGKAWCYRIWSNGWIEQWGTWGTSTSSWATATGTYPKAFKNTNYYLFILGNWNNSESSSCTVQTKTTTGFTGRYANNTTGTQLSVYYACGF